MIKLQGGSRFAKGQAMLRGNRGFPDSSVSCFANPPLLAIENTYRLHRGGARWSTGLTARGERPTALARMLGGARCELGWH